MRQRIQRCRICRLSVLHDCIELGEESARVYYVKRLVLEGWIEMIFLDLSLCTLVPEAVEARRFPPYSE